MITLIPRLMSLLLLDVCCDIQVAELISGSEGEPLVEVITSNPYFDDKVDGSVERVARKRKLDLKALRRAPSQVRVQG